MCVQGAEAEETFCNRTTNDAHKFFLTQKKVMLRTQTRSSSSSSSSWKSTSYILAGLICIIFFFSAAFYLDTKHHYYLKSLPESRHRQEARNNLRTQCADFKRNQRRQSLRQRSPLTLTLQLPACDTVNEEPSCYPLGPWEMTFLFHADGCEEKEQEKENENKAKNVTKKVMSFPSGEHLLNISLSSLSLGYQEIFSKRFS